MPKCNARRNAPKVELRDPAAATQESPERLIHRIAGNALTELRLMMRTLGNSASAHDFASLEQCTLTTLMNIGRLIEGDQCSPWINVKHSPDQPVPTPSSHMMRIGVFPIAANPLHWAHLIGGLFAIESLGLDKVIYVIAGEDPRKPFMAPPETRHQIARSMLSLFDPLFAYSSIARGAPACGEENFFKILAMNPRQRIHAFYIAGSDHCHRWEPGSRHPDTIQKLEDCIANSLHSNGKNLHSVSVAFLRRGGLEQNIKTTLDVRWVRGPPVRTSSTTIRSALPNPAQWENLSTLPFAVFSSIRENHLYQVHSGTGTPFASA